MHNASLKPALANIKINWQQYFHMYSVWHLLMLPRVVITGFRTGKHYHTHFLESFQDSCFCEAVFTQNKKLHFWSWTISEVKEHCSPGTGTSLYSKALVKICRPVWGILAFPDLGSWLHKPQTWRSLSPHRGVTSIWHCVYCWPVIWLLPFVNALMTWQWYHGHSRSLLR